MAGKLLDMQQPVLVTGRDSVSARCRSETTRYMNALKDFQIWAVRSEYSIHGLVTEIEKESID